MIVFDVSYYCCILGVSYLLKQIEIGKLAYQVAYRSHSTDVTCSKLSSFASLLHSILTCSAAANYKADLVHSMVHLGCWCC